MPKTTVQTNAVESLKTNEKKWSKPLMDAGWTALPSVIIENQRQLMLTPLDMNIILYLASKWWKAEGKPFPSKSTMAKAMDVHPRTIQKHVAAMEGAGYITREERRTPLGSKTNVYHLDGLIKAVMPFAEEKLGEVKDRQEREEAKRNRRGAPRGLKLVHSKKPDDK
jgi:DNA-binding transcriptional regulator YhcF (GntR family)